MPIALNPQTEAVLQQKIARARYVDALNELEAHDHHCSTAPLRDRSYLLLRLLANLTDIHD